MNPNPTGIKTWQWVVTAVVIIALIILGFVMFSNKSTTPSEEPTTQAPAPEKDLSTINRIIIGDQYPGNVVFVSSVQVQKSAWVVIHADNAGQPGKVIGTAWADAGINPVRVTLTSPMVENGTYYAVLNADNGDKKFNEAADAPLKDASGNVIMRIFHASSSVNVGVKG